jgi:neutral ceramidase
MIIGQAQFAGAKTLMNRKLAPVSGSVKSVHIYMNMCVIAYSLRC